MAKAAIEMIKQQPGCGPPAPVPILQWESEFSVLLELYRRSHASSLLEIGTYHGGTLYHWLQNSDWITTTHVRTKIVTADSYVTGVDNRPLYDEWNVYDCDLVVVEGDTNLPETSDKIGPHGPFDWLFIDAGHYLHEVTADWNLYRPMVREGGIACLHDILTHPKWPSIEVGRLWEQIKKEHMTFEIVADRQAEWGGIGVVLL